MSGLWNERQLKRPTMLTYTTSISTFEDIENLISTLQNAFFFYQNQKRLKTAYTLCSRIIFLRGKQFRTEPGFKCLNKIKTAFLRYESMHFSSFIDNYFKSITVEKYNDVVHLPTKETFQFLLIKFQGMIKILTRIIICTKEACEFFIQILKRKFFVELNTLLLGILAEIWTCSRILCKKTVKFLNTLIKYQNRLKGENHWLPEDYKFPQNLCNFIEEECHNVLNTDENSQKLETECFGNISKANIESNLMTIESIESIKITKSDKKYVKIIKEVKINKLFQNNMEIGEEVSRDEINKPKEIKSSKNNVKSNNIFRNKTKKNEKLV